MNLKVIPMSWNFFVFQLFFFKHVRGIREGSQTKIIDISKNPLRGILLSPTKKEISLFSGAFSS